VLEFPYRLGFDRGTVAENGLRGYKYIWGEEQKPLPVLEACLSELHGVNGVCFPLVKSVV